MSINIKSVFVSGFVAGIVINIVGLGLVPIVGNQMNEVLKNLSLPPLGLGAMIYFPVWSLTLGMFMMWIYAFIQSNFDSKIKAAIAVSLVVWFLSYFSSNAALVAYGFMPFPIVAIGTLWGLLELVLASIIGSKIYRDKINLKNEIHP
jgi:hypothetical protein